jgi:MYXO-CTERM domain-containing protein
VIWFGGVAAVVALLTSAEPVSAFYWYGWPGSKLPPDRTVVTPPHKDKPGNPPERPPVNPPEQPPVIPPGSPVPEPATALAALAGLGALAATRAWRRRKS